MDTTVRIRAARRADKDSIAALIADALQPSSVAAWLVPDPATRRRILADVVGIWVEHAMFFGDIYLTDDLTAAAVGFRRYRPIPAPANYPARLADAAGPHSDRFDLLHQALARQHPTEPHYHLTFLAVAPPAQQAGRGKALLAHHHSRVDRVGLPSWTTATAALNLYARYGYTPRAELTLPDGPTLYPMRRNPDPRSNEWPLNT
ncbi:GNAT family N-acetyltransferase, partial [Micromonospora deserti]